MEHGKTIVFKPDKGLRETLEKEAARNDRTLSWIINALLREALEGHGFKLPSKR